MWPIRPCVWDLFLLGPTTTGLDWRLGLAAGNGQEVSYFLFLTHHSTTPSGKVRLVWSSGNGRPEMGNNGEWKKWRTKMRAAMEKSQKSLGSPGKM